MSGALAPALSGPGGASTPALGSARGQVVPAPATVLSSVSCATAARCWAVGAGAAGPVIVASADGGARWESQAGPAGTNLVSVSCNAPSRCLAVGTGPGGGPAVAATADGRHWLARSAPAGLGNLLSVSCWGAGRCATVGSASSGFVVATTADGGGTWTPGGPLPPGVGAPGAVSCRTAHCVLAGWVVDGPGQASGVVAISDDGGATWQSATLPAATGVLHGAACPSASICLAAGTTATATTNLVPGRGVLLASSDDGAAWRPGTAPAELGDGFALSCATAHVCVAAGAGWPPGQAAPVGAVAATGDGGRSWWSPPARYLGVPLTSVSCPVVTSCLAVGGGSLVRIELPARAPTNRPARRDGGPTTTGRAKS